MAILCVISMAHSSSSGNTINRFNVASQCTCLPTRVSCGCPIVHCMIPTYYVQARAQIKAPPQLLGPL